MLSITQKHTRQVTYDRKSNLPTIVTGLEQSVKDAYFTRLHERQGMRVFLPYVVLPRIFPAHPTFSTHTAQLFEHLTTGQVGSDLGDHACKQTHEKMKKINQSTLSYRMCRRRSSCGGCPSRKCCRTRLRHRKSPGCSCLGRTHAPVVEEASQPAARRVSKGRILHFHPNDYCSVPECSIPSCATISSQDNLGRSKNITPDYEGYSGRVLSDGWDQSTHE